MKLTSEGFSTFRMYGKLQPTRFDREEVAAFEAHIKEGKPLPESVEVVDGIPARFSPERLEAYREARSLLGVMDRVDALVSNGKSGTEIAKAAVFGDFPKHAQLSTVHMLRPCTPTEGDAKLSSKSSVHDVGTGVLQTLRADLKPNKKTGYDAYTYSFQVGPAESHGATVGTLHRLDVDTYKEHLRYEVVKCSDGGVQYLKAFTESHLVGPFMMA